MYIDWFSYFFGVIAVFIIPIMTVITWSDTYRGATRYERLDAWQIATLIATTMLAAYTYFFVRTDEVLFVDETTLWVFCGIGVSLSIALGLTKKHITNKQRRLEDRLKQAVLSR